MTFRLDFGVHIYIYILYIYIYIEFANVCKILASLRPVGLEKKVLGKIRVPKSSWKGFEFQPEHSLTRFGYRR